jgi:hypothetical protein
MIDSNRLFDPRQIGPFSKDSFEFSRLGRTLYTWGYGALLNPAARRAFDWAAKDSNRFSTILAEAEGRDCYEEGRKRGSRDRPDSKRRVKHQKRLHRVENIVSALSEKHGLPRRGSVRASVKAVAKKTDVSPSAIRKSMSIARRQSQTGKSPD